MRYMSAKHERQFRTKLREVARLCEEARKKRDALVVTQRQLEAMLREAR